ncbi:MAG: flavin reductase family protein [Planctomycetia bacterium]|nr:flavin reductase family protein [Planctomycetia bacterium]
MPLDARQQRKIMGHFATGVTVVGTALDDGTTWGMTANAVTSLSLDPPLVLVAVDKGSQTAKNLQASGRFAISILSAAQEAISRRFAGDGPRDFSGLATKTSVTGSPILSDAIAWIDCEVSEILPGGDHDIYLGRVVAGDMKGGDPLLFFCGKYARLAP